MQKLVGSAAALRPERCPGACLPASHARRTPAQLLPLSDCSVRATLSPELEPSATRCLPRSSQPGVCILTFAELTFVRVQWHDLEQMQVRHCARLPLPALPAARPCAEIYLDTWRWAPVRNSVSVSPITGLSDNNLWPFSLVGHVGGRLRQSVDDEHHVRFGRSWLGNAAG